MHIINKGFISKYKSNAYRSVRRKTGNPIEEWERSRHFTEDIVQMANKWVHTTTLENFMSLTTETERVHVYDPATVLLTEVRT